MRSLVNAVPRRLYLRTFSSAAPALKHDVGRSDFLRSKEVASAFEWLIHPISSEEFLSEYWEKKPLHIKRNNRSYYDGLLTKRDHDELLTDGKIIVNVAKTNAEGRKVMKNLNGNNEENTMEHVNKCWKDGYSIQALHPQQHHAPVAKLLSALEGDTTALWHSNAYITPKGARGFAPHYDDVEVFMCQLEGAKHWQLFRPPASDTNNQMELPKTYSIDFLQSDFNDGDALFDGLLEQGDLLYMPRGTVHTGRTPEDVDFSHHLTVSTYQASAWSDFLNECLPGAIENATRNDRRFREGLPLRYLNYIGSKFQNVSDVSVINQRNAFRNQLQTLFEVLKDHIDPDDCADNRKSDFVLSRLNPNPVQDSNSGKEVSLSSLAPSALDAKASGLQVRWRDPNRIRLALDVHTESGESEVILNYFVDGEEDEVAAFRFQEMLFPALRALCRSGPNRSWIVTENLGGLKKEHVLKLLDILWQERLIDTRATGKKRI